MSKQIAINKADLQDLIIYAQRYTIGRMTYAPYNLKKIMLKHLDDLTDSTIQIVIKDIELGASKDMLGNEYDKKLWLDLLEKLRAEIEKRGKR